MAASLAVSAMATANTLRTVALTRQAAPDVPGDAEFSEFSTPVINTKGQTAFRANVTGSDLTFLVDQGIWSEGSGNLALVAREGDDAPGTPSGVNFAFFGLPVLNASGQTAFAAATFGSGVTSTNDRGIWSEGSGSLTLVAREGDQAPGTPNGVNYNNFIGPPLLNDAGQTAFSAYLTGDGVVDTNAEGIWSEGSGSLSLVARAGNQAPGLSSGVNFMQFGAANLPIGNDPTPVMNVTGQVAFAASLTGGGPSGIWMEGSGGLAMVARDGDQAPGTPSGTNYGGFGLPVLNAASEVAFIAGSRGSDVSDVNKTGIWSGGFGSIRLVAREGEYSPGTPDLKFGSFIDPPVLNAVGQTAFVAFLRGSGVGAFNSRGIWSEGTGSLALVARLGDQAPGTPSGVNYMSFYSNPTVREVLMVLNAAGQTAFFAFVTGSGVTTANDAGIWATDRSGQLSLIAREGDLLEVAPGQFRTISLLSFAGNSGNQDGRRSGFNDRGQVAFYASFTDGSSGVFVSNLVAVPEPSSVTLLLLSLSMLSHKRPLAA